MVIVGLFSAVLVHDATASFPMRFSSSLRARLKVCRAAMSANRWDSLLSVGWWVTAKTA